MTSYFMTALVSPKDLVPGITSVSQGAHFTQNAIALSTMLTVLGLLFGIPKSPGQLKPESSGQLPPTVILVSVPELSYALSH